MMKRTSIIGNTAKPVKKRKISGPAAVEGTRRANNWSVDENIIPTNSVQPRYSKLFGKFSSKISSESKQKLWSEITSEVNSVGLSNRTVEQVKVHWTDLKSRTKSKASLMLREKVKTGGGETDLSSIPLDGIEEQIESLSHAEKNIVFMNGKEWLVGIGGGFDTANEVIGNVGVTEPDPTQSSLANLEMAEAHDIHGLLTLEIPEEIQQLAQLPTAPLLTPKSSKQTRMRREASDVTQELLDTEKGNLVQLTRIAGYMEEMVKLYKYSLGLNPVEPLVVRVVNE